MPLLPCLPGFLTQHLAGIANALLFIDVGRLDSSQVRRNLPNQSLVSSLHIDQSLLVHLYVDSNGNWIGDWVDIAYIETHRPTLHGYLVANSGDFQVTFVALRHTLNYVTQLSASQPVQRTDLPVLI